MKHSYIKNLPEDDKNEHFRQCGESFATELGLNDLSYSYITPLPKQSKELDTLIPYSDKAKLNGKADRGNRGQEACYRSGQEKPTSTKRRRAQRRKKLLREKTARYLRMILQEEIIWLKEVLVQYVVSLVLAK